MERLNQRLDIVTRNLQEFIGTDKLQECLEKTGIFSLYWGTAPTGRPHIAYFLPMTKIADFLKAGCDVTILFADLHAYLDNMKAPWELLQKRTEYYEVLIKGMLKALSVPLDKLHFVRGTEHQLQENYTANVYQIIGITTAHDAAKAGCEVVKQTSDPYISGIIYPLLQALDEEFLGVDAQFGGVDQRKIFTYAEKYLPNLGFAKRAHLMNPMIPGLTGGKMSASEENSKIDLLDDKDTVIRKLKYAKCSEPTSETNGLLAFIKFVILPIKSQLSINLLDKYETIEQLEKDFAEKIIDEETLKKILEEALCMLMGNLVEEFSLAGKHNLDKEAYPNEVIESHLDSKDEHKSIIDYPDHLKNLKTCFPEVEKIPIDQFPKIIDKPTILWSVRASGEPHIGYLVPLTRLANMSNNDWKVVILIEDIGAHLHSHHNLNRTPWNLMKHRTQLYRQVILRAFTLFNGNLSNLSIVVGSDFQLSKDYALLMYQSFSKMTERECHEMITKIVTNQSEIITNLSSVVYPCIQSLDQIFLRATVRLVGDYSYVEDFRTFSRKLGSRLNLGTSVPLLVTHDMILSLTGDSLMKSPRIGAKTAPKDTTSISMCDDFETANRKMKKAYFDPKKLDRDPSLIIIEKIIWPALKTNEAFVVPRTAENGGNVEFTNIKDIFDQLINDLMHPGDVKLALVQYLSKMFLEPMKKNVETTTGTVENDDFNVLFEPAYPLKETKKLKNNKKSFNPNRLDLRIASIESIVFQSGLYTIVFQCGSKRFSSIFNHCYAMTPNDLYIVAVRPSFDNSDLKLLGILCAHKNSSKDDGDCNKLIPAPRPLRISKKSGLSCAPSLVFNNYEAICPHLKETNENVVALKIEESLLVDHAKLLWAKDGSCVMDLELVDQFVTKVFFERF